MRACKQCAREFEPILRRQKVCGPKCANDYVHQEKIRKAQQAQRRKDRAWKLANKPLRKHIAEAQAEFNRFIRIRDRFQNCISCDRAPHEIDNEQGWKPGGAWDCGHFLSATEFPELRFCEDNAHRQCKSCNSGSHHHVRKKRTVERDYRDSLVKRIGIERVEWLEGPHEPVEYTPEVLQEIRKKYQLKAKELENYDHEYAIGDSHGLTTTAGPT